MSNDKKDTALIILAAGKSSRLGRPKQLLKFEGMTLLQRAIQAGLDAGCKPLIVVMGAYHTEISQEPYLAAVKTVVNPHWEAGMGSSIKAGMRELREDKALEQIILMLCDQPFVDGELLKRLVIARQETGKGMVACSYGDTLGVPALFGRQFFPLLSEIDDAEGAKKLIQKFPQEVAVIPFERGNIDIDTAEDYRHLTGEE